MSEYIRILAKETAQDFYFAALFAPQNKHNALFTIAAFHGELTSIRKKIKNELAGQVRLQWWHDAIDMRQDQAFDNPLFKALLNVIDSYNLPKHLFLNKINAHIFDLYDDPFPDVNTMEGHYGETLSSVFMLNSIIIGTEQNSEISGLVGVAYGLWSNNQCFEAKKYYLKAKPLLNKSNLFAHLPLFLTPHKRNISELHKIWVMWRR